MDLTAQYTLTPAEALRGTRTFKRRWYALSVASGVLLILMGLTSFSLATEQRGMGAIMLLNGLLFLVLPEAVLRWARLRRGAEAYPPMEITFNDEGLTLRTETSEGSLAWEAFEDICRRDGFWIFRINRSQAVIIPGRALDDGASAELAAFLRAKGRLKA